MLSDAAAYLAVGGLILAAVWLPLLTRGAPVSLPIFSVAVGFLGVWWMGLEDLVTRYTKPAELLTTIVLIVAVLGSGLKIDRRFSWRGWTSAWRLLGGAMPLSVLGIAVLAGSLLGLPMGEAILLAGILAPTDPVLASSFQLGPPGVGEEGEVRFALTSEGALNDGLAFPFVLLGGLLLSSGEVSAALFGRWFVMDAVWKTLVDVGVGLAFGWGLVRLNQALPERFRLSQTGDGLASLAVGFMAYGLAEFAGGFGLVAVFVAAVAIRSSSKTLDYTRANHDFAEQIERLAMVLILTLFGGAIAGGLLSGLQAWDLVFAALVLFAVRPAAALASFVGSRQPLPVRLATGFLGVRGLGSLFYMAYSTSHLELDHPARLWSIVSLVVLLSIIVYGVSGNPAMRYLDRLRERAAE